MKSGRTGIMRGIGIVFMLLIAGGCSENGSPPEPGSITPPPSITGGDGNSARIVTLTENQALELGIQTYEVKEETIRFAIYVPGIVIAAPEHVAVVSTPVNGRITRIFAHEGEEVKKGDPLLEMESLEFAELAANYLEAEAERTYLEQQAERLTTLVERKISPQSSLDRARADLSRANTRVRASRARLQAVGIDDRQMELWKSTSENERAVLTMYARIDGKINHHLIDLGQAVSANDMLLDIVNTRQVLVRGFADPEDISLLTTGARAVVSQRTSRDEGRGAMTVETEITTIQPGLDQENRAIIVNSIVNTQNQWPVIGQSVRVEYEAITPYAVISVPLSAVQFEGQNATVFLQKDTHTYESRPVVLDRILRDTAILRSGLVPGDKVAATQIFSLKALGKFEEFAED
jgi:membrane fusion protein, heavy metal efflux system